MVESTSQTSETPQSLVLDLETLNIQYSNPFLIFGNEIEIKRKK
jgi:hypothetical protein